MNLQLENSEIVVIGQGKVGKSLSQLFDLLNVSVTNIGRSKSEQISAVKKADIVLLCVDDASIEGLCKQLASSFPINCVVSHCSGALDSSVLSSARDKGCSTASTHPLNTFPNLQSSLSLFASLDHGSHLYAEGESNALEVLLPLFESVGFTCQSIRREAKPFYHAACVFACNYLTSLMSMSLESAAAAGLDKDQFWTSVQPLINATLKNISDKGVAESLSGPIARGDNSTIESHIRILNEHSAPLKNSYVDLGLRALEIAIEKGELNSQQRDSLRKALKRC